MDSFFKMVDVQTVLFIYMAVGFFCRKKAYSMTRPGIS